MDHDAYIEGLRLKIKQHGYTFIGVFDPEGKTPSFVYSIGLTARGWPEVILIGNMNPRIVEIILTDLINSWKEEGRVILGDNPGAIRFADGSSHPLRVVPVDEEETLENWGHQARVFYDPENIQFVQVLWPDLLGTFPDEEGYLERMHQPLLKRK
jgi:hypothetical protein